MDVRERINDFVKDFKRLYLEELGINRRKMFHNHIQSQIFYGNLLEKYLVDKKLLSFLENNSNLKGKSLNRFLWIYFKKKLNQDLVEFFSKEVDRTHWTIPKKVIKETNNNIIKLCEKEIKETNNKLIKLCEKEITK